jgi:hyperosmotically inducible protein
MKKQITLAAVILCGTWLGGVGRADDSPPKPDNTKVNRDADKPTADQQHNNKADRELAQSVRKAIVSDKTLSTYAHNIKVIAQDGIVTLRGPVHSEDEKKAIVAKATEVAGGPDKVKDLLVVKGDDNK